MRRLHPAVAIVPLLASAACGPVFVLTQPPSRNEILARAEIVVIGVIEQHHLESWPYFRVSVPSGEGSGYWRVARRRVRVEAVLHGSAAPGPMDVYEVFWTGGASGNWNSTQDGERAIFPLRKEHGFYRLAGDWNRSIFPVTTGRHTRLPLDASRPLWERITLMNWWIQQDDATLRTAIRGVYKPQSMTPNCGVSPAACTASSIPGIPTTDVRRTVRLLQPSSPRMAMSRW